jgi:hypothetical protein
MVNGPSRIGCLIVLPVATPEKKYTVNIAASNPGTVGASCALCRDSD